MDAGAREQLEELAQSEPVNRLEPQSEAVDDKPSEIGPIPIETIAEPLERTKPRRPRARVGTATPAAARSTRKTAAPKKPAARTTTRSRKTVRSDSGGKNES
jgi:hypothetical protein